MQKKPYTELEIALDDLLGNPMEIAPSVFQYYRNLKDRKIIINDQIDSTLVEQVIIPLLEMDNDGTGEPIEIILCSLGGSVFDGMPLCNIIDQMKTPLTITVLTYAYSMGGLILMAGYNNPLVTKQCYRFSTGLVHSGSTYLEGTSHSVKDMFDFYSKYDDMIRDYILSHSRIEEAEYERMERYEWYMDAQTMLDKGLVDKIIE